VLKYDKCTHSLIAMSPSSRDSSTCLLVERNRPHFVTTRWALSKGIEAYSRVFTVDHVADDQREFTISRAVGMRFVPLFLSYNFSFAFSKISRYHPYSSKTRTYLFHSNFMWYYCCRIKLIKFFKITNK